MPALPHLYEISSNNGFLFDIPSNEFAPSKIFIQILLINNLNSLDKDET